MVNTVLFRVGNRGFSLYHLAIIGVLVLAFTMSFLIRVQPIQYGYELHEFDPYFNYRATDFLANNGLQAYLDWNDDKVWHPFGRDISSTSQTMLHVTAAATHYLFGGDMTLYEFTIIFPVIFGSLTCIVIFALVRVLGGTVAGLISAVLFAVSVPVLVRGMLGWFKSEPLGLFYGLLGVYLFLSGFKSKNTKIALAKVAGAGICLTLGLSAWGGNQFLIIPISLFFLVLPFLRDDHKLQLVLMPTFAAALLASAALFETPGIRFVAGPIGLVVIMTTAISVICSMIQIYSRQEKKLRNGLIALAATMTSGLAIASVAIATNLISPSASSRYLAAINPFKEDVSALVRSVAEHATPTLAQSFFFHSVLIIFAGLGAWLLWRFGSDFRQGRDMIAFSLIIGLTGVYISTIFIRLQLFASIALIILSSIGIAMIAAKLFASLSSGDGRSKTTPKLNGVLIRAAFCCGIVALFTMPLVVPANGNWIDSVKTPATIFTGGTPYSIVSQDWPMTMEWIRDNTPEDSVIAAWWDYGYWITALTNRTSLADNGTLNSERIAKIAKMFVSTPDEAWRSLRSMDADYVLIFVVAQKLESDSERQLYQLQGGGDESKKRWFVRIAGEPVNKHLHADDISGTKHFWENTILGQMFPYTPVLYYDLQANQQFADYQPGTIGVYSKEIKLAADGDGPLRFAYASPSFTNDHSLSLGVLIYEVNKDYVPAT